MIFNQKKGEGKSDVECVKNVFETMGARQRSEDVVRLRQRDDSPNI